MLAIRMQRLGRKGHAQYRVIVQDSRRSPASGRVVAKLGHYDPHTKKTSIDSELAVRFLSNGAQPSERVVKLFTKEGIKLPDWVSADSKVAASRATKNPDKLRKNRPADDATAEVNEPVADAETEASAGDSVATEPDKKDT